jgi:hypothetical protein
MKKLSQILLLAILFCTMFLNLKCKKDDDSCPICPQPPTDTTSHAWTFTKTLLGDGASSVLYDVAIINDTLAYAVGEISIRDSAGNWPYPPYNLAIWNGQTWRLQTLSYATKVLYPGSVGSDSGYASARSLFTFNERDIWIAAGTIQHYDGTRWQQYRGEEAGFSNKMWGTSSTDMYFVSNGGRIIHYNGSSWTKIQSGTTLPINDIWGGYNYYTKHWEILAVATQNYPPGRTILSINGNTALQISSSPIGQIEEFFSVWFVPNQHYYVIGDGIYEKSSLTDNDWKNNPLDITHYATTRIRGNAINDIFVVGAFGELLHYNGNNWYSFQSVTSLTNGAYTSVAIRNNLMIAVGGDSPLAVVTIGYRH